MGPMSIVIACAGLKGGIGKTALALHLGDFFHHGTKLQPLIVDLDPQRTASFWASVAADGEIDGPPVVALEGAALRRDLARVSSGFSVVLLDCPPRLGRETRAAMLAADLILTPVVPGPEGVWALGETLGVLDEARGLRPEIRAVAVLNRASRTQLAAATREALEESGVTLLEESLGDRVAFGEAVARGRGVWSYAPKSPAAEELEALARAVIRVMEEQS